MAVVLTANNRGNTPSLQETKDYAANLGVSIDVLADDGSWLTAWAATNGSQHTYAVINSHGVVAWRKVDGSSASIEQLKAAVDAAL